MKNSKHTPGPWVLERESTKYMHIVEPNENIGIATINIDSQGIDPDEANINLIIAAPDMLEALIQSRGLIIQLCNDIKSNYGLDLDVNTLIRVRGIDDAIAKAQGES